jgi:asparagine synthase (glutamine-hydrolysing)
MSRYAPQPVKTFSLTYADAPKHKVDAYYARKVAEMYGTEHHEYVMEMREMRDDLEKIVTHLDQPFAGVVASYWLSRFMRQYVTVALSGDGADDFFASYGHHRLVRPIAALQKARREKSPEQAVDFGFFSDRKEFVRDLSRYAPWEWRLSYAAYMDGEKEMLFSDAGRGLFMPHSTSEFLKGIYNQSGDREDELNNMLYLDINTLLPNEILYFNDMLSMAHSLEVRTPFLDYRIAELAASIPGSLKIKGRVLKYILRKVAVRYVPQEIINRPKEGFVLPKNTWLREGMSPMLHDVLSKERLSVHGYFNLDYVDSLVRHFLAGDDSLTFKIWTMMVFQVWYEGYLSGS